MADGLVNSENLFSHISRPRLFGLESEEVSLLEADLLVANLEINALEMLVYV
jgi:hypothetical protein